MYSTKFILAFNNELSEFYEIYFDFLNYTGIITELIGSGDCLTIRSTGGDEDKMEPILGTEALVDIFVDANTPISISDLIAQHDNDIRVTIYREKDYSTCVFQGFIVVEDNSQPFLDPPFTLSVRALDGLGLLKGVDLVDTNNLKFVGPYSVISWIAQILNKTGQTLPMRVFFDWFNIAFTGSLNPLEQTYLHSITFSQGDSFNLQSNDPSIDINALTADDCYTALEKIVRCFRCRLFQEDGCWNLVNLNDYLYQDGYGYTQFSFGDPVSGIIPATPTSVIINQLFNAPIGKEEIIFPIQEDQILYLKLATKWIKLTYTYDQSQNKICNQDFSEGDRNATYDQLIPDEDNPAVNDSTLGYDTYCWQHFNGVITNSVVPNPLPASAADKRVYIRSVVDILGYEKSRYLVIEASPGPTPTYIQSSSFLIDTNDKIDFSVNVRTKGSHDGLFGMAWILLTGDDGTFWALTAIEGDSISTPEANKARWVQVDSQFRNSFNSTPSIEWRWPTGIETTNTWTTVTAGIYKSTAIPASTPPNAPISGSVSVYLLNNSAVADEWWYKNLSINIYPYLQGSYVQLKGDFNYCSSNNNIKQTDAEDVEISDSPKRYFKGALVTGSGSVLLAPNWFRPGHTEALRFTQAMEGIIYTHLSRIVQKIEGTFKGLIYRSADYKERPCGYLNQYNFTDSENPDKKYMLTSFEKNYGIGTWRGVFVETLKDANDPGFIVPDSSINYVFSYLFQ